MKICTVNNCNNKIDCKNYCSNHYKKWRKYGDPLGESEYNKLPPKGFARCRKCGLKPINDFYPDKSRRGTQTSSECKVCFSKRRISLKSNKDTVEKRYRRNNLARFGLTVELYDKMFKNQNGLCKICEKPETDIHHKTGLVQRLTIDHDHDTGKVRGLLCATCNKGIGLLKHDKKILGNAIKYLTESEVIGTE